MQLRLNTLAIILGILITLTYCKTATKNNDKFNSYKVTQFNNTVRFSVQNLKIRFDNVLRGFKDTVKSDKGIKKIEQIEMLQSYCFTNFNAIEKILSRIRKKDNQDNIQELMLGNDQSSYARILTSAFERATKEYKQHNPPSFFDTIPWSRRYRKLIRKDQSQTIDSFGEFYFKQTNKEEALLILNLLESAILQEALEVQQKIINEK